MPPALKDSPARGAPLRMANRSIGKEENQPTEEDDPELYTLQNNLSRFAKANNRKLILQTFHTSRYLENVTLDPSPVVSLTADELVELETIVGANPLVLNDHEVQTTRSLPLTMLLKSLVLQLCEGLPNDDPDVTYSTLLARLYNSTDVFQKLQELIGGAGGITLKQAHETKRSPPPATPTVDIYQANGVIHCRTVQVVHLGLFRKSDLTVNKPWMWLTCTVHERFNFSTKASARHVVVEAPQF